MASLKQSVLVTGGGGFLGKAIVRLLLEKGCSVRSFSRSIHPELNHPSFDPHNRIKQFQGDLSDYAALETAAKGVDSIYHVAAKAGVWGPYEAFHTANVIGTQNVIGVVRKQKIPRLIYTSSPSAVFDGTNMCGVNESVPYPLKYHAAYPETKAMAERLVIAAGKKDLSTIILRPHLIWGPEDNHLTPRIIARAHRLKIVGKGDNKVDTIYVDNAAKAHILADEALSSRPELSGRTYFISQDDPIPLWQMVNLILAAGGKPPITKKISYKTAYRAGSLFEFIYKSLKIKKEPLMTRFVARELATSHWFDISAAKRDLGYVPSISTAEGLNRLKVWMSGQTEDRR